MDVSAALIAGRRAALGRMRDTVRITAPATSGPVDDDTLRPTSVAGIVIYQGPCRLVAADPQESSPNVADSDWTLTRYRLDVPVDGSVGVYTGCRAEILSAAFDPDLQGNTYRVLAPKAASQQTARRLALAEVGR